MLSIAKLGVSMITGGRRQPILRNQGTTVYDIYKVRYAWQANSPLAVNEITMSALSTRLADQVNDVAAIGFDDMMTENGIFCVFSFLSDLLTEGGLGLIAVSNTDFPADKPYTVPFASWIINVASGSTARVGVEVYFERREVNALEKATLVRIQAGGRTRPSG